MEFGNRNGWRSTTHSIINMKLISKSFENFHVVFCTLLAMLLAQTALAETWFTNEVWISPVAQTNWGNGTLDYPYDGSTRAKFDTVMGSLPPNCTVHLLAGTYQTYGTGGWNIQSGQKILGSGIDNTIVKLVPNAGNGRYVFVMGVSENTACSNIEVADLTLDAGYTTEYDVSYDGVYLTGSYNTVRHIKVINTGGTDHDDSYGILIGLYSGTGIGNCEENLVEHCEIGPRIDYSGNGIVFSGGPNNWISGTIRNNSIGTQDCGIIGKGIRNTLIEGNHLKDTASAICNGTGSGTNIIVVHNIFEDCYYPVYIGNLASWQNLKFCFNTITLHSSGCDAFVVAAPASGTNIVIIGNNVGFESPLGLTGAFLGVNNITGLVVANNMVDPGLNSSLSGCTGVNMYFNYDLQGNLRTDLDTMGFSTMTSLGRSLMSSANPGAALVSLGLPANPAILVTNNQKNVSLNGTFTGSGAALSGVVTTNYVGILPATNITRLPMIVVSGAGRTNVNGVYTWSGAALAYYNGNGQVITNDTSRINDTNNPNNQGWIIADLPIDHSGPAATNIHAATNIWYFNTSYQLRAPYSAIAGSNPPPVISYCYNTNVVDELAPKFQLQSGTRFTNEFWISTSTNTANLGTLDNPFDGSTQAKFDGVMHYLCDDSSPFRHATIHLLAGTYQTLGDPGRFAVDLPWRLQDGQKLLGSGIDSTIIQLVSGAASGSSVISSHPMYCSHIEVADLTVDCNYTPASGTVSYCGVGLAGTGGLAVRRVKVINLAGADPNHEVCGITFVSGGDGTTNNSDGNVVEECEIYVIQGQNADGIAFNGGPNQWISGAMRNNRIIFPGQQGIALNGAWMRDVLIEGNYVKGSISGLYGDTGGYTNIVVTHNVFEDCQIPLFIANVPRQNLLFSYNTMISTTPTNIWWAIRLDTIASCTNVAIIGNTVTFNGIQPAPGSQFMWVSNVTGLIVANNRVDPGLGNAITGNTNVSMYFNYDLQGNLRTDLDTMGFSTMTSLGRSLMSSASPGAALVSLGLPANPAILVTNNQKNVSLNGTFTGSGAALSDVVSTNWICMMPVTNVEQLPIIVVSNAGTFKVNGTYTWSHSGNAFINGFGQVITNDTSRINDTNNPQNRGWIIADLPIDHSGSAATNIHASTNIWYFNNSSKLTDTYTNIAGVYPWPTIFLCYTTNVVDELAPKYRLQSGTPFTNEVWISTNTNTGNLGTLDNPFDGSTHLKFDSVMNSLPANCTVHLLAGTYQTLGSDAGYVLKTGQKILGAGVDNTIIQLVPNAPGNGAEVCVMVNTTSYCSNNVVSDLTLDANFNAEHLTCNGLVLHGSHQTARNVKVINTGQREGVGGESWGVAIDAGGFGNTNNSEGNVIENCEIGPVLNGLGDGIALNCNWFDKNSPCPYWISGVMRNNRIYFNSQNGIGINGAWMRNVLIEGNYISGAVTGFYGDTGGYTNLIVAHNVFENCDYSVWFANYSRQNLMFCYNTFSTTKASGTLPFYFSSTMNGIYTNISIVGNLVTYNGNRPGPGDRFLVANNTTGLIIANNTIEAGLVSSFSGCTGVNMYFNYDLKGNLRTDLDTMGFSTMTTFGRTLMSSASSNAALVSLGLPANPAVILTTNQSLPVAFNTNVTVNGTLNYSNMVAQLVAGTGITANTINTATGQVVTVNANSQTNGFGNIVTHNVAEFSTSANATITNVTIRGVLNYSNMVAQLVAGPGITTSTAYTPTGQVVAVNGHITKLEMTVNVTNVLPLANSLSNIIQLSFTAVSNKVYKIRAVIYFTTASTNTGSRWCITGPTNNTIAVFKSEWTLNATNSTRNAMVQGLNLPSACNASSAVGANLATIEGFMRLSTNGVVSVAFASEVANSAVVAQTGSTLEYW
jgi:hypothetical protein